MKKKEEKLEWRINAPMPQKFAVVVIVLFVLIVISGLIFLLKQQEIGKEYDKTTISKQIVGILILSNNKGRGMQEIEVLDSMSQLKTHCNIHASYFFETNNIKIGDSINKKANSNIIEFFKRKKGRFEKCCEFAWEL